MQPSDNRCPSELNVPPSPISATARTSAREAKDHRVRQGVKVLQGGGCISSRALASLVNLSPSRFRHLFRLELGISPTQYLKLARMRRAQELLQTSDLRVKEICGSLGVHDISHFVRDYKMRYGETPSQTRRLMKHPPFLK